MRSFRNSAFGLAGDLMQFGFVSIIESNPEQLVLLVWCSDLPSLPNCSGLLIRLEKYGKLLHTYLVLLEMKGLSIRALSLVEF